MEAGKTPEMFVSSKTFRQKCVKNPEHGKMLQYAIDDLDFKQKLIAEKSSRVFKTGASLIPDLNVLVERMRKMTDDRYIYMTYMLPKTSEYFTPYSLK